MTVRADIKEEIIKRIDNISDEMLLELLDLAKNLEGKSRKDRILSFSGIWRDMDDELFDDFTKGLHERRDKDIRH